MLFCWELGGGLGHMMQMLPLAEALAARGHRVIVALRQLERAVKVFGRAGVRYLQAPAWNPVPGAKRIRRLRTFTQLLVNVGFGDDGETFARACAWRNLFQMTRPDVIVFDHAPTALLASRGMPARRALIGSGFCCPPDETREGVPWGMFTSDVDAEEVERLLGVERNVLGRVNRILRQWKQPEVERLGQLYADVDENFLTTLPELEQYPRREAGPLGFYWGPVLPAGGAAPRWPDAPGKRVFGYVKKFDGLGELASALRAKRVATLLYLDGPADAAKACESDTVCVARERPDMARVARECDAAVMHAGQGTTAALLMAGKPLLNIPLVLEQRLTANAVRRTGAGLVAPASSCDEVGEKLDALLDDLSYANAARRVALKYASFDPAAQVARMVERIEGLVEAAEPGAVRGRALLTG